MIYCVTDPAIKGRRFKVFDANGLEWTHVVQCNTATGEITRNKLLGGSVMYLDESTGEMAKESIRVAAPLLVVEQQ
jgi:hypothetical protein